MPRGQTMAVTSWCWWGLSSWPRGRMEWTSHKAWLWGRGACAVPAAVLPGSGLQSVLDFPGWPDWDGLGVDSLLGRTLSGGSTHPQQSPVTLPGSAYLQELPCWIKEKLIYVSSSAASAQQWPHGLLSTSHRSSGTWKTDRYNWMIILSAKWCLWDTPHEWTFVWEVINTFRINISKCVFGILLTSLRIL